MYLFLFVCPTKINTMAESDGILISFGPVYGTAMSLYSVFISQYFSIAYLVYFLHASDTKNLCFRQLQLA